MNVAIVQGRVKGDLDRRVAQDGTLLVSFDVAVLREEGGTRDVPITWAGSDGEAPSIEEGTVVTVVGHVFRRFYRTSGRTVSRTDVRADRVVRGAGVRAASAIEAALRPGVNGS